MPFRRSAGATRRLRPQHAKWSSRAAVLPFRLSGESRRESPEVGQGGINTVTGTAKRYRIPRESSADARDPTTSRRLILAVLSISAKNARSISMIERIEFWRNRVFDFFRIRLLRKSIFREIDFRFRSRTAGADSAPQNGSIEPRNRGSPIRGPVERYFQLRTISVLRNDLGELSMPRRVQPYVILAQ